MSPAPAGPLPWTPTKLTRTALAAGLVGFGGFGVVLFASPDLLSLAGVVSLSETGVVELRAFYGGLELGLAVLMLLALVRPEWTRAALAAELAAAGGVAVARTAALVIGGGDTSSVLYTSWGTFDAAWVLYASLAGESLLAVLAAAALWQSSTVSDR